MLEASNAYHRLFADRVETVDIDSQFNFRRFVYENNNENDREILLLLPFVIITRNVLQQLFQSELNWTQLNSNCEAETKLGNNTK